MPARSPFALTAVAGGADPDSNPKREEGGGDARAPPASEQARPENVKELPSAMLTAAHNLETGGTGAICP